MFNDPGVLKTKALAPETDADLFQLLLERDEQAFTVLVGRYSGLTYASSLRILRDFDAAQDVSQAVLFKLWAQPERYIADRGSLGPWLTTLARNRSIDLLRKRTRYNPLGEMDPPSKDDHQSQIEQQQTFRSIRPLLAKFPEPQRRTLEMSFLEELTHAE